MKNSFSRIFFLTVVVSLFAGSIYAADSPWIWERTLQETSGGEIMRLPTAIHIDPTVERYYVVDGGNRLLSYDRGGRFLSSFSAGDQLQAPFDMVREEGGIIWLVEKGRNTITKIDLKAKKVIPKSLNHKGKTVYPDRLEIVGDTIFLLDKANGSILELNKDLEIQGSFECDTCRSGFVDFKIALGKLWALEQQEKAVYVFSMSRSLEETIALDQNILGFPRSLAIDKNGFIFILDRHAGKVHVFNPSGQYKYSFLSPGQARGQLYYPIEIKFDPWGMFCVVEEGNGRVQIFKHR